MPLVGCTNLTQTKDTWKTESPRQNAFIRLTFRQVYGALSWLMIDEAKPRSPWLIHP